jgi:flavin-dependent dehydrogenase
MTTPHPIEIVGGGLAGLSLGLALRREGIPVTLHEAGTYPRHRVCGEFITGLEASTISRLHLADALRGALRHHEVAWCWGNDSVQTHRLPSPALGISRHRLDAHLARQFVAAGGELRTGSRLAELENRPGRVFANGRRRTMRSLWLGLKIHARGLTLTRDLEMHLGGHSYVGLTRVETDVVNICGLFRRRAITARGADVLLAYLRAAGLTTLAGRIAAAGLDPDSFCAVAALEFDRRMPTTDRLCLGDAGATIPPFTGNGMAMAFQSAEIALAPLLAFARGERSWAETCGRTNAALRARFRVRLASADAVHPFLLQPRRQRWAAALGRARLLPFGSLYASLH